jgi:peroxiredoxin Q/BCP
MAAAGADDFVPAPRALWYGRRMIDAGQRLPDFELLNQDGHAKKLADYAGKWLVLYVYPKDDTPGCTIQGKSFTASKADYDAEGVVVVGLSQDDVQSHRGFCDKFAFTIELLADTEAKLLGALGAGQSEWKGTSYWNRTTFVVDPGGVVRKVYTNVKPDGHEKVLLDDIRALKKS